MEKMNNQQAEEKAVRVIKSCKNLKQIKSARKYLQLFMNSQYFEGNIVPLVEAYTKCKYGSTFEDLCGSIKDRGWPYRGSGRASNYLMNLIKDLSLSQ